MTSTLYNKIEIVHTVMILSVNDCTALAMFLFMLLISAEKRHCAVYRPLEGYLWLLIIKSWFFGMVSVFYLMHFRPGQVISG